jgi:hypothetical protein
VPEDVGGTPFSDGWEPNEDHDRGGADEEFATVVFDEDFVRSARIHEPSAVERLLAAAEARAEAFEAEARRGRARGPRPDDDLYQDPYGRELGDPDFDEDLYDPDVLDDGYGRARPYGARARWHRTVAWLLALVMGIGMVALAFTAVYRGASSSGRQDRVPPASTEVNKTPSNAQTTGAPVEPSRPAVTAAPHTP